MLSLNHAEKAMYLAWLNLAGRFFDDLTLGLLYALNSVMGVENVMTVVSEGVTSKEIADWQKMTGFPLPPDLISFYEIINGLHITWGYKMRNSTLLKVGLLKIESLYELKTLGYVRNSGDNSKFDVFSMLDSVSEDDQPKFNANFKIVQLEQTRDGSIVCLVYSVTKKEHSIWLLDRSLQWQYITDSFTKYFYMMVKQAGLPQWQMGQTDSGLSMWAKQLTYTFALCLHSPPTDDLNSWSVDGVGARASYETAWSDTTAVRFTRKGSMGYTEYFSPEPTRPKVESHLRDEREANTKILLKTSVESKIGAIKSNQVELEESQIKSGSSEDTFTTTRPPIAEDT